MPKIHHQKHYLQQGLKTANPEYKGYSARLNRWNKIPTPRKCKLSKQVFIQLYQGMGCSQHLNNYSLLMCESLLSDFRYQLNSLNASQVTILGLVGYGFT